MSQCRTIINRKNYIKQNVVSVDVFQLYSFLIMNSVFRMSLVGIVTFVTEKSIVNGNWWWWKVLAEVRLGWVYPCIQFRYIFLFFLFRIFPPVPASPTVFLLIFYFISRIRTDYIESRQKVHESFCYFRQ